MPAFSPQKSGPSIYTVGFYPYFLLLARTVRHLQLFGKNKGLRLRSQKFAR